MAKKQQTKPEAPTSAVATIQTLKVADILSLVNSRIENRGLKGLATSIERRGLLHPITVRRDPGKGEKYQIIAGHRRYHAVKSLGMETIKASVFEGGDVSLASELRAVENLEREDLSPLERAIAAADLIEDLEKEWDKEQGSWDEHKASDSSLLEHARRCREWAVDQASLRLGRSREWVQDQAFIIGLPQAVQNLVHAGKLPIEHARELAKVGDPTECIAIANNVKMGHAQGAWDKKPDPDRPAKSIDKVRTMVSKACSDLKKAPWQLSIPFAGKVACTECPKNSKNADGLFAGNMRFVAGSSKQQAVPEQGLCLDLNCYRIKQKAFNSSVATAAKSAIKAQVTKAALTVNGKPAKAPEIKVNAAAAAKFTPVFAAPADVTRQMREIAERTKDREARKAGTKSVATKPAKAEKSDKEAAAAATRKAFELWEKKVDAWIKPHVSTIEKKLDADPILCLQISILDVHCSEAKLDGSRYEPRPPKDAVPAELLDAVADAVDMNAVTLHSRLYRLLSKKGVDCQYLERPRATYNDVFTTCIAPFVLTGLGIATKDFPKWADFAPKPKPEPQKPEAKASSKKPAKPSKAKKAPAVDEDDDPIEPSDGVIPEGADE